MGKPFPLVMTQRVRDNDNAANTSIVGASCVRVGKAGHTADSIQYTVHRLQFTVYDTQYAV